MSTCELRQPPDVGGATSSPIDPSLVVQFLRYLVVGGLAFAVDFGGLIFLTSVCGWHYLQSAAMAYSLGLALNYVLSVSWVFNFRSVKNHRVEFLMFALIGVAGLGLNQVLVWSLTDGLGLGYSHSKLVATPLVLVWNFAARKLLLFTTPAFANPQEMIQG